MHKLKKYKTAVIFLLPNLLGITVFLLLPFLEVIRRSFCNTMGNRFTGLYNYYQAINNEAFRLAAWNTVKFTGIALPLLLVVSLLLALAVRVISTGKEVLQTTYMLPMALPISSIVLLWKVLFYDQGLINGMLLKLGLQQVSFLSTDLAFYILLFTYIWKNAGYDMILWLAGLDSISKDIYESAEADGADAWQRFWYITIPELKTVMGMTAILSFMNLFKIYREAYLVSGKYPHESVYLLQHLFNNWFLALDLGRITAAAVMMTVVVTAGIMWLKKYWQLEE